MSSLTPDGKTASALPPRWLPSSAQQVGTIAKYELLNYFGSRRFFALLTIAVVMGGLLTLSAALEGVSSFGATAPAFYSGWYFGGIVSTYVVIFCAVFFGGDAISSEFQNKSGYFLVAKPIRRSVIYIGKYLGALLPSLVIVGVFTAITLANGIYYFGATIPIQFSESFAFTLVWLISVPRSDILLQLGVQDQRDFDTCQFNALVFRIFHHIVIARRKSSTLSRGSY